MLFFVHTKSYWKDDTKDKKDRFTRDHERRGNKRTKRSFADLTVMRELDYDRATLRDELIANKFYTSMQVHSVSDGGFEVDDIVGIVNRCTWIISVKTMTERYTHVDASGL